MDRFLLALAACMAGIVLGANFAVRLAPWARRLWQCRRRPTAFCGGPLDGADRLPIRDVLKVRLVPAELLRYRRGRTTYVYVAVEGTARREFELLAEFRPTRKVER